MISLLKSSAGSGKTYNLAKTYIRMLLSTDDPRAYRHILAVTFTNKATEEMKSRILKELDILSRDTVNSPYFADFTASLHLDEEGLRAKSSRVLSAILQDYSAFAVSTIDKFFQQALRSFAREIGQFASYQVELDKESLVKESVDRILDSLSEDAQSSRDMIQWLSNSALSQLESGSSMKLESGLYRMASNLMSEGHRTLLEKSEEQLSRDNLTFDILYSQEHLSGVRRNLTAFREQFRGKVAAAASEILSALSGAGVSPGDFYRGFMKQLLKFADPKVEIERPTSTFVERGPDPDLWFAKKNSSSLLPLVRGRIEGPIDAFISLFGDGYKAYVTAGNLIPQLYDLGIARELRTQFQLILKEKNVLSIDDSNVLLRRIISSSDAPFVYEKMGVRFENFLLDEFQDTSKVQWENFAPLLSESDANGRENLLVGDVKQSIYRWRDSDWKLFQSGVEEKFPGAGQLPALRDNWRSLPRIVKFNNAFFTKAAALLDVPFGQDGQIGEIYRDVCQNIKAKDPQQGSVRLTFCDGDDELDAVLDGVLAATAAGASYGQIAVVVRINAQGSEVAARLNSAGIPVISDESLKVKSSPGVRLIVSLLSLLDNPQDKVGEYQVRKMNFTLPTSWLSLEDLCEQMVRIIWKDGAVPEGEVLYVQAFLDDVISYARTGGNNLHLFLEHWKDASPSLSSPQGVDAVRIITIHKSKGLEFPYVIIPFLEKIELYSSTKTRKWIYFSGHGTPLEGLAEGLYYLGLSRKSLDTLYGDEYLQELMMQYIDNINNAYVAFTRAEKGMHIIGKMPKTLSRKGAEEFSEATLPSLSYDSFCDILYAYARSGADPDLLPFAVPEDGRNVPLQNPVEEFISGGMYDFSKSRGGAAAGKKPIPVQTVFRSYTMDGGASSSQRLRLSSDAYDFFSPDGGVGTSSRLRGIVMHDILSRMVYSSDLDAALDAVSAEGGFASGEEDDYRQVISTALRDGVVSREEGTIPARDMFFPDGDRFEILRERTFVRGAGKAPLRPDRIILDREGKKAVVVDYKFTTPDTKELDKYLWQVRFYCQCVGRSFHVQVRGYLWFMTAEGTQVVDVGYGAPHRTE